MADTKFIIAIQPCEDSVIYDNGEWKGYVFDNEKFDEVFLIKGNNEYKCKPEEYPSWYKRTCEIISELSDNDDYYEEILEHQPNGLTGEKDELFTEWSDYFKNHYDLDEKKLLEVCSDLKSIYDKGGYSDSLETVVKIGNLLYPDKNLVTTTIRGSVQREWQEVTYDANALGEKASEILQTLSDFYWGEVQEIHIKEVPFDLDPSEYDDFEGDFSEYEDYWDYIGNSTIWNWQKEGLAENFRENYGIEKDTKVEVCEIHKKVVYNYEYENIDSSEPEEDIER